MPRSGWERFGFAPWVEPAYRWFRPALPLLGIYAIVRAGLLVADALAGHLTYGTHPDGPLTAWDGHWYLSVAAHGYPASAPTAGGHLTYGAAGFEPVFPVLIRAVEFAGFTAVQAAVAVSLVAGAVSVILVWRLGTAVYGQRVGSIGAMLFSVFPGMAIAWGMTYSECVGLALAAGCLLLMVKERWFWAGVTGAVATATSPMALPLTVAALVAVVQALRGRRAPRALVAAALIPMGFVAYVVGLGLRYHDMLYWWHLQHQAWSAQVDFGKSLLVLLVHPWSGGFQGKGWMEWVGLVAVVASIVVLVRAKPPLLLTGYCIATFALMFVSNSLGFKPRFLAWAFPALIAVAAVTRRRGWQPIAISFAFMLPIVFLAYASLGNLLIQP
ncbi:MAG TPA: hypothetical protein VMV22_09505 [Acidimicrobiales bacterium]|nr:hypothetical protein [Acidimicrobiales bacterium]